LVEKLRFELRKNCCPKKKRRKERPRIRQAQKTTTRGEREKEEELGEEGKVLNVVHEGGSKRVHLPSKEKRRHFHEGGTTA